MRIVCLLFICIVATAGCDMKTYVPPSFAAQSFAYTKAKLAALLPLTDINCTQEMQQSNSANANLHQVIDDTEKLAEVALRMADYSYAQALFYDCNMRQQAADDGVKIVADNDSLTHYRAYKERDNFWDMTRFVEWNEYKNDEGLVPKTDGEANRTTGKMMNFYLQDNGFRTQTRIELDKKDSLRQITSLFYLETPADKVVQRGHLVEYKSGTDKEHLLSLRLYHDKTSAKIYLALAHFKTNGSAVLVGVCDIGEDEDYNKSCTDSQLEVHYFDANQKKITADADLPTAQFKATQAEFLQQTTAKWTHGEYEQERMNPLTSFFSGSDNTKANRENTFSADIPRS